MVVLYVRSASSTSSPPVLANVSLPGVKSSIFADAIVAFVSTSNVPVTLAFPVTVRRVPLYVRLALSSISPPVPASTTLPDVKSSILAVAIVADVFTSRVLDTVISSADTVSILPVP